MFFQHNVEVGAAKAVGADAAAAGIAIPRCPCLGFVAEKERRVVKINVGIGRSGIERGRQNFVVNSQGGFEQTRRARARLQVADVALGGTQGDAAAGRAAKDGLHTFHFHHIAHAGAGSVRFDQGGRGWVNAGIFPRSRNCQLLSNRIRGGDTLAFAIAGPPYAANNGVNAVAIPFCIFQPL